MSKQYKVRIAFLDVGQGDTTVISIPETEEAIVVDCIDADAVIAYLQAHNIKHLRGLIITHLHLDHYKEAVEFLNNCERETGLICEKVMFNWPRVSPSRFDEALRDSDNHSDPSDDPKTNQFQRKTSYFDLKKWVQEHKNQYGHLVLQFNNTFRNLGSVFDQVIELLHPHAAFMDDLVLPNNSSAVLKIRGPNSSAILMSDLEYPGWEILVESTNDLHCDVLKFPHHGAWKDADPKLLIDTVVPSVIIISVGTSGIRYNHPNPHVFDAIAQRPDIHLMCTQVTEQCSSKLASSTLLVKKQFETDSDNSFSPRLGCPCAGSIILELGNNVEILQPTPQFHQEKIIKTHFDTHKCKISANL